MPPRVLDEERVYVEVATENEAIAPEENYCCIGAHVFADRENSDGNGNAGAGGGKGGVDRATRTGREGRRAVVAALHSSTEKFAGLDLEATSATGVVVRVVRHG